MGKVLIFFLSSDLGCQDKVAYESIIRFNRNFETLRYIIIVTNRISGFFQT